MSPFDSPCASKCSNPNRDDYWTCPGCYGDLGDIGAGEHTCPDCGRRIECSIEYEPACHTRLIEQEGDDDVA